MEQGLILGCLLVVLVTVLMLGHWMDVKRKQRLEERKISEVERMEAMVRQHDLRPTEKIEREECHYCPSRAVRQAPKITVVRSMFDTPGMVNLLRKMGLQPQAQYRLQTDFDIETPATVCQHCGYVQEEKLGAWVAEKMYARAKATAGEAMDLAEYASVAVVEEMTEVSKKLQSRRDRLVRQPVRSATNGSAVPSLSLPDVASNGN